MYAFEDLEAVHAALNLLMRREPPLVKVLSRQPGTKESRYMHLLAGDAAPGGDVATGVAIAHATGPAMGSVRGEPSGGERIAQLEMDVDEIRSELETLRQQFAAFQKQFQ
jgi:hypothetical protein